MRSVYRMVSPRRNRPASAEVVTVPTLVEVERSGADTTATMVGSRGAGVVGSSVSTGDESSAALTVAWFAIRVPLAVSGLTRAVKRTNATSPGNSVGIVQVMVLP